MQIINNTGGPFAAAPTASGRERLRSEKLPQEIEIYPWIQASVAWSRPSVLHATRSPLVEYLSALENP